jgi:hypothetical protein
MPDTYQRRDSRSAKGSAARADGSVPAKAMATAKIPSNLSIRSVLPRIDVEDIDQRGNTGPFAESGAIKGCPGPAAEAEAVAESDAYG